MDNKKLFRWILIIFNAIMLSIIIHIISNFNLYKGKIAEVRKTYITHDILGWRYCVKWPNNEFNNNGFRGRKYIYDKDDFVIIILGDSQAESICTDFEHIAENCLEKSINHKKVKVFSIGAGGYGNDQELIALQEYFDKGFRADLVLLWFTPTNDSWNNTFPHHVRGETKPTFILKDGIVSDNPQYFADEEDFAKKYLPAPYMGKSFNPEKNYKKIIQKNNFDNYTTEKTHTQIALSPASPRATYGYELTNKLIKRIEHLCYQHLTNFVPFYIILPGNQKQFFDISGVDEDGEYFDEVSGKSFIISTETYNKNIKTCLEGFDYIEIKLTGEKVHPDNDMHLNNEGNTEAMSRLAAILSEKKIVE